MNNIGKVVLSTSAGVVTNLVVVKTLDTALNRVAPGLSEWKEEWSDKEKAIQSVKVIGSAVGIAILAGLASYGVQQMVSGVLDGDNEMIEIPEEN